MKRMKKFVSALLAVIMVLGMSMTVFAVENDHVITITNTDQNVSHDYEAYQIFKGNLDAAEEKLSDIEWGNGVDAAALIAELKTTEDANLATVKAAVAEVNTTKEEQVAAAAKVVAEAISGFSSTTGANQSAGAIDAFASIVAEHLETKAADFIEIKDADNKGTGKYTANVTGDGYYFIKDVTLNLNSTDGSDTLSKYLLSVVRDTTIVAKDTGLTPDKNILEENNTKVKEGTAAIGDTVSFKIDGINVPNTTKYEDHFVLIMNDQMDPGLTFMNDVVIKIGGTTLTSGENYTLTVKTGEGAYGPYTAPEDAVVAEGGQAIRIVFNNFKSYVEENNLIGQPIEITYSAVVNDDATFGVTGNENEVVFDYSNNPNYDYDGDTFGPNDPQGHTPKSETTTYVTALEIFKYTPGDTTTTTNEDGTTTTTTAKNPLAGAEFEITGTAYTTTLVTGEKYVENADGEYWKLLDGSYTKTDPTTDGINDTQYASTTTKYKLVEFEEVVTTPEDTKIIVVSGEDGIIKISGLKPGEYTVKETKAPDGYNKIETAFPLIITWSNPNAEGASDALKAAGGFSIGTPGSEESWIMAENGALYQIEIMNQSGSLLPSTGGIGTTIFYVVGGILVVGAGILLVAKKRMSANK